MKIKHGINYSEPEVTILQDTGIGHTEIAARTAYDSFEKSEHGPIQELANSENIHHKIGVFKHTNIESSKLLNSLAWVYHHHSVLEHSSITYLVRGTGRGVLQELVRHRIASYTVQSSRYTMGSIINAYIASSRSSTPRTWFIDTMNDLDILITTDERYNELEYNSIYEKLAYQELMLKEEFYDISIAKSSRIFLEDTTYTADDIFKLLEKGKAKRNIGDPFKHIVTDNWKTDLVMTINLRSLKNFFELRDSGASWFQMQWLAQAMKLVTPYKYLKLIDKKYKDK